MQLTKFLMIAGVPAMMLTAANCANAQESVPVNQPENPATESVPATQNSVPAEDSGTTKITIEIPKFNLPEVEDVKITPSMMVQVQYAYATNSHKSAGTKDQNGFFLPVTCLGLIAEMNDGWSCELFYEFDSDGQGGDNWYRMIDTAIISKKFDAGTLTVGHRKNHFDLEQYSPLSEAPCIELSLNSNFLKNSYAKGLNSYHCGIEWAGTVDNFDYGIAVSNAVDRDYDSRSNDLAITYWIGRKIELGDNESLYLGLNGVVNFGNEETSKKDRDNGNEIRSNAGTVYAFEPFIRYKNGGFTATLDCYYVNGVSGSANIAGGPDSISDFYGVNLTLLYLLDCGIEPAFRVTYLHTNSGLIDASCQNHVPEQDGGNDMAYTIYGGANYYFNKYVKLSAGYEYGHLYGGSGSHTHDYGILRTQLQFNF